MKRQFKKYPLLISLIVSAVIIVASLFVIGFKGLNFDTTFVGGSQIEIVLADDADAQDISNAARIVAQHQKVSLMNTVVEDKFTAGADNGSYTKRVLILTFLDKDVSEETQLAYREELAEKIGLENADSISEFQTVTNIIEAKNIWFIVLAVGIIIACIFVFAWIRYDLLAGVAFLISYLHSIMLFFALSGLTRAPIGLTSLGIMILLNFIMSAAIISIFEDYRKVARLHIESKDSTSVSLFNAQKSSLLPYAIIAGVAVLAALLLLLSPAFIVRLASLSIMLALICCIYTTLLIAPAVYANLVDIRKTRHSARVSRNDTKNKVIKKKIASASKEKEKNSKTKK